MKKWKKNINNIKGIGVVEVVLILLVLVGLVLIFKNQIIQIVDTIFSGIHNQIRGI